MDNTNNYADIQHTMFKNKCHLNRNLPGLLIPWRTFRLYILFRKSPLYGDERRMHFYGHEEKCTYNQCRTGRVQNIVCNKKDGWDSLINLLEVKYRRKYISAKIYGKSSPALTEFDVLHREYVNGRLVTTTQNDPAFDKEGNITMYKKAEDDSDIVFPVIQPDKIILHFNVDLKGNVHIFENQDTVL